jgi:hypothetical protein
MEKNDTLSGMKTRKIPVTMKSSSRGMEYRREMEYRPLKITITINIQLQLYIDCYRDFQWTVLHFATVLHSATAGNIDF